MKGRREGGREGGRDRVSNNVLPAPNAGSRRGAGRNSPALECACSPPSPPHLQSQPHRRNQGAGRGSVQSGYGKAETRKSKNVVAASEEEVGEGDAKGQAGFGCVRRRCAEGGEEGGRAGGLVVVVVVVVARCVGRRRGGKGRCWCGWCS
jgi:hypothetical protein